MDEAVADGFTVLRAWATAVDPQYSLEPSPGNFSEPIFRGLDYVLDQARQRNLKVRSWPPSDAPVALKPEQVPAGGLSLHTKSSFKFWTRDALYDCRV